MNQATRKAGATRRTRLLAIAAVLALLSGCATAPPPVEPEPVAEPPPEPEIPIVKPVPEPLPPASDVSIEPPAVTIVLSSRSRAYEDVAMALAEHYESALIYDISDKSQPATTAFRAINDLPNDAVVAIGLRAARSSVALSDSPVIFSQVFNYQDHSLLNERSRGVAAIAPLDAQLAAWKEAEPALASVGLVVGPGHDALVEEAELAAARHGVRLTTRVASSDQEALYYFKRMVRDIDGFWLLPDNRVLSARVLHEIAGQAKRRRVSVLVPNRNLLSMGATISVSTVAADIAARIHGIVERINQGQLDAVAPITALTEIQVEVNDSLLSQQAIAAQTAATLEAAQ